MTLQRAVLADFHLPVGAVAESQAANVTQLIERLRIATPRRETEFAIGQREEGGRGARRGDGERLGPWGRQREPWIKALHIHTVERKCTEKIHSLSQNTHVRTQATVRMPFMTAHLL